MQGLRGGYDQNAAYICVQFSKNKSKLKTRAKPKIGTPLQN